MAQITEAQLFENLGRVYAEVKALSLENTQLRTAIALLETQLEGKKPKNKKDEA